MCNQSWEEGEESESPQRQDAGEEAALIAWAKGMQAKFQMDLAQLGEKRKREKQESEEAMRKQAKEAPK